MSKPNHRIYTRGPGPCRVSAPCGAPCCLNNSTRHALHVCRSRACVTCHPAPVRVVEEDADADGDACLACDG